MESLVVLKVFAFTQVPTRRNLISLQIKYKYSLGLFYENLSNEMDFRNPDVASITQTNITDWKTSRHTVLYWKVGQREMHKKIGTIWSNERKRLKNRSLVIELNPTLVPFFANAI